MSQITALRNMATDEKLVEQQSDKNYAMITFLQQRLVSHISKTVKVSDGVREVNDDDIVHFRQIRVHSEYVEQLRKKIDQVKHGEPDDRKKLAGLFAKGKITQAEFERGYAGRDESIFNELRIRKLLGHYYFPVVLGSEKAHYIKHIVKVKSEVDFLDTLETWITENEEKLGEQWDAWMFSKIDESLDRICISHISIPNKTNIAALCRILFFGCAKGIVIRLFLLILREPNTQHRFEKLTVMKSYLEKMASCAVLSMADISRLRLVSGFTIRILRMQRNTQNIISKTLRKYLRNIDQFYRI